MDFYTGQDNARRSTALLVGLFVGAIAILVLLINALVLLLFFGGEDAPPFAERLVSADSAMLALALICVFVLVSLFRWMQLSRGGSSVAMALGGQRLDANRAEGKERRLLNVVEEMAIAAGVAVPEVYLLRSERGINAFAAGHGPADAVIGITQGAVDKLDRQQLQGVIAHEFSHILNGDMALNLKLMGLLAGILFLNQSGRILLHAGNSRSRSSGQIVLLGMGLWLLGSIGYFFAQLIKAAISRQREYLADASAVQFTRDPNGIADALKLIAADGHGSSMVHPGAGEASHLFFGNVQDSNWFATHPPLQKRIRAIQPGWDGKFAKVVHAMKRRVEKQAPTTAKQPPSPVAQWQKVITPQRLALATTLLASLPGVLRNRAEEPWDARLMWLALLQPKMGQHQTRTALPHEQQLALEQWREKLSSLSPPQKMALVQLSLASLRTLSPPQQRELRQIADSLDVSDNLLRWSLVQLLRHYLDGDHGQRASAHQRRDAAVDVLRFVAFHGHQVDEDRQKAFYRATNSLGAYQAKWQDEAKQDVTERALTQLRAAPTAEKARLKQALGLCIEHDGEVTESEQVLHQCLLMVLDIARG